MSEKAPTTQEVAAANYTDANGFIDNLDPSTNPNISVTERSQLSNLGDSKNASRDLKRGFSFDSKEATAKGGVYGDTVASLKTENDGYYPRSEYYDPSKANDGYERTAQITHAEVVANDGDTYIPKSGGEKVTIGTGTTVKYEADSSSHSGENAAKVTRSSLDQSGNRIEYVHKFKSPKAAELIAKLTMKTIERAEPSVTSASIEERKAA